MQLRDLLSENISGRCDRTPTYAPPKSYKSDSLIKRLGAGDRGERATDDRESTARRLGNELYIGDDGLGKY